MLMIGFPLLLLPLAICNLIVFLMPDVSLAASLATITLTSGANWSITLGDVLVALAIVLLLLEVMKAARPGTKFFTDHLLALIVFGAAAAEFVMLPRFGNSTFFLLTLIALVDFVSGVALRVRRGRRMVMVPADSLVQPAAVKVEPTPAPVAPAPVAPASAPSPAPVIAAPAAQPASVPPAAPVVTPPVRVEPVVDTPKSSAAPGTVAPVAPAIPSTTEASPSALAQALTRVGTQTEELGAAVTPTPGDATKKADPK